MPRPAVPWNPPPSYRRWMIERDLREADRVGDWRAYAAAAVRLKKHNERFPKSSRAQ